MHPHLNIAIKAARAAGEIIMRHVDRLETVTISTKAHNDFVTTVDKASEDKIIEILRKAYPQHAFLGEETGGSIDNNKITWIIDPLDGTYNFMRGFGHFAVSIASIERDVLENAVIYDPIRQDLFTASRGRGAQLNGKRMRVSNYYKLDEAVVSVGCKSPSKDRDAFNALNNRIFNAAGRIRCTGSAALNLAYVAAGKLDGHLEAGVKPWDIAAGILLVQEAGGYVSDYDGGEKMLQTGNVIAGARKIYSQLFEILQGKVASS